MRIAILLVLSACGSSHGSRPADASGDGSDSTCPTSEIAFTQETGCGNDGSVEFCIPDNDLPLLDKLNAISPTITCTGGGGRAGCLARPGLLLCTYPTQPPDQCVTSHGAMTDPTWEDMCEIAALPQVTQIVHTIFE